MTLKSEALTDQTGNTVFRVELTDKSGIQRVRTISLEDYITLLQGAKVTKGHYVHLKEGFLPEGVRDAFISDQRNYIVSYVVPGRKRAFLYQNGYSQRPKRHVVPYPDLAFILQVSEGHVSIKKVFALKGEELCNYPFGNVSRSGDICMGNIESKDLESSVDSFTDDFFMGVTNNDYFDPRMKNTEGFDQPKLLHKLSGLDKFPDRWLVTKNKNLTDMDREVQSLAA